MTSPTKRPPPSRKGETVEMAFADPEEARPVQPRPDHHERKLWFSVLELAYRDATGQMMRNVRPEERSRAEDRDQARKWFASDGREPGTLRWILEMTGLPVTAGQLRRRVMENAR